MNAIQKASWAKVREGGRDEFLLKSIGIYAVCCGVALLVIDAIVALFGRNPLGSLWETVTTGAALSLISGVWLGFRDWNQNERDFHTACVDSDGS